MLMRQRAATQFNDTPWTVTGALSHCFVYLFAFQYINEYTSNWSAIPCAAASATTSGSIIVAVAANMMRTKVASKQASMHACGGLYCCFLMGLSVCFCVYAYEEILSLLIYEMYLSQDVHAHVRSGRDPPSPTLPILSSLHTHI